MVGHESRKEVPMRSAVCWGIMLASVVWISAAWADIYVWVDEDGLRHISNMNPPPHAEVLLRTEEPSNNDASPGISRDRPRRQNIKRRETDIREREIRLAKKEAELERRIAAVEKKAQAALEAAAEPRAAAEAPDDRWAGDYRYVLPTYTYIDGYSGDRHDRRRTPRDRGDHRRLSPSWEGRPFHLGAIHLPLGPLGVSQGRNRHPGGLYSPTRPNGEGPQGYRRHPVGRKR